MIKRSDPNPTMEMKSPKTQSTITRSEPNNSYPTTFVQADTSSFKQVVQMLTGSTEPTRKPDPVRNTIPPIKSCFRKENKSSSKLYERRKSFKNLISPLGPAGSGLRFGYSGSPRPGTPELLSPSILDFPSLVLSPITPLISDPFNKKIDVEEEDKAIKEKGFFLHRSPVNSPMGSEPRLLPLFPVTSPRVAESSTNS